MSDAPVKFPKPKKTRKPPVRSGDGGGDSQGNDSGSNNEGGNWKGILLFISFAMVLLLVYLVGYKQDPKMEEKTNLEVMKLIKDKKVVDGSLSFNRDYNTGRSWLEGKYKKPKEGKGTEPTEVLVSFKAPVDTTFDRDLKKDLQAMGQGDVDQKAVDPYLFQNLFVTSLPLLLLLVVGYFLFRQQIRMAGKSAFSFGRSKARMLSRDRNKITFKDVAGIDEAKEELSEIVEFLKDPKKFQRLGGRIPKGVLMIGPPGTGKTLLAKAIAGEADVPFFSISGSDFVEMFVGVGASRVRDMFEQGKKNAPCLIFIDEIDAVGRSRGTGMGGGHDEREQTLNALLVEMDGIETAEGVIIIAATNRKDVLDPALLRPGRFDREVRVDLPDVRGREQILKVHAKNIKLAKEVELNVIARGTPGYSGAELANVMNEAALLAAKRNRDDVGQSELEEARDKVRWGRERRSMAMSEEEKRTTAIHEAGHALLNVLLEHTDPIHKVSIIPRGPALGVTMMLPEKDKYSAWKRQLLDDLCVVMGGRVAEEVFLGDISSGASGDIRHATYFAKKMVCEWGMSETLGMVLYNDDNSGSFFGRDLGGSRTYSEKTAQEIDKEVSTLLSHAYARAKDLITSHRETMEQLTNALLEYETLDGKHVIELIKTGKMQFPPPRGLSGPVLPTPSEPLPPNPVPDKKEDSDGLLPGLQGAPA
ncbi:MAG: ATP-dependent zinc metalloprotease FtsH [Candidatus Methylacidiphilales bacterium]|nr:ATP-dependent zinc metalloprotease FtsH [Candidatus Methylacidiphilales bacterium]